MSMDIQLDLDIHGSYPPSTSSWMWSVLSMDIQLDIHPLPSLNKGARILEGTSLWDCQSRGERLEKTG
jgi:hypothetical protein